MGSNEVKMQARMKWAEYRSLDEKSYFLLTKELFDMEIDLGKDIYDSLHPSRRFEYPWVFFSLQPFTKDDIVIDAGAGTTVLQLFLSKGVKEIHSVEKDVEDVAWLNKVKQDKGFTNFFPVVGDLTNMTFPSSYFDKTICISVLEHLAKDKVADGIEELIRATKPQGKIAITMDIVLEKTDVQVDLTDFERIAKKYSLNIPDTSNNMMVFRTPPHNFPFATACILLEKF